MKKLGVGLSFLSALVWLGACSAQNAAPPSAYLQQPATGQAQVLQAQQEHARYVEVTLSARVQKLLPPDTKGLPHQRFLLHMDNGTTVLVAHDTKLAPSVPLKEGDLVVLHGEYIWNEKGGVLHWTHHSPNGHHEGGWIDLQGHRYQ